MKPALRNGLIIAGILALTFFFALAITRRQQFAHHSPAPSTFNASPQGLKAAYAMLERLRRPVERWQHPWTKLAGRTGALVYADLSPEEMYAAPQGLPVSDEECRALARWIANGNRLLLYANPDWSLDYRLAPLLEKLRLIEPATNRLCRVQRRATADELFEPPSREPLVLPSVMPTTFTRGVRQLEIARNDGWQPESGAYVPLVAGAGNRLHALWLEHGRGRVLIFSSASFIDNEFLRRADNLALFLGALRELAGDGAILFDEYHHGYSLEFAMRDFLRLPMVKFAAAQLALLVGLLIASQWRRFGEPVPLVRETRRSVMEYAVSLGDLYARAETQLEALDFLFGRLRRELAERSGLRPDAGIREIAARLDGPARQAWETLAVECERRLQSRRLTRLEFARLARQIQQFRRQLR